MAKEQNYLPGVPDSQETPQSQLLEYWLAATRGFRVIALLALAGCLTGFGVALLQHPLFRARTVLDIRSLNENVLKMHESNSNSGSSDGGGLTESYLQTEIKLLQSETILRRAIELMPKQQVKPEEKRSLSLFSGLLRIPGPKLPPLNALVADASQRIKIRALGNTRIVEILCDARDGQIAAAMCNNLAQAYSEHNLGSRLESTSETGRWLSSQLESVRRRLSASESALKDSANDSSLLFNSEADNPAEERLRQLQAELSHAQAERIIKQSELEVVLTSAPDALPLSLDVGPLRDYRLRLAELRRQLAEMSATMTPEHYKVRELKQQIAVVEASLQKERKDLVARLQSEFDSTRERESLLSSAYESQAKALSQHGDRAVQHEMIKRDVDSTRRLYEALMQRVEEVNLANAMRASSISIVDKASPPTVPYSPNWMASAGIGLLAGMCLGLAISILRSHHDQTLRDPGEAPRQFQIRELGVIPAARSRTLHRMFGIAGRDSSQQEFELAEAFCGATNSLLLTRIGEGGVSAAILTSPDIGDGKTSVATNLAITLARAKRRVVLVDGDMRRPRLQTIFDLDAPVALDAILRDDKPIDQMQRSEIAISTWLDSLFILPTAAVQDDSISDLLFSRRLPPLIQRLREEFDIVLIDTPPMSFLSDARVFGSLVDGAVLIFRSGTTTLEAAWGVQQCLLQDGTPVLGTILNHWEPRNSSYYLQQKRPYTYSQS